MQSSPQLFTYNTCTICTKQAVTPVRTHCCQYIFCRRCLQEAIDSPPNLQHIGRCPVCRCGVHIESIEHLDPETMQPLATSTAGEVVVDVEDSSISDDENETIHTRCEHDFNAAALEGNHVEIVKLLLGNCWTRAETGKDVSCEEVVNIADGRGATPLMVAASRGNVEIASLLLRHGAKVNVCNHVNRSPLVIAALKAHLDIIFLLVDNGADIHTTTTTTTNSEGGSKQRHQLPAATVAVHQDVAWLMEHRRSKHHNQARKLFGKNIFHIATGSDREDIVHTLSGMVLTSTASATM